MAKPAFHIFVCVQHRAEGHPRGSCGAKGGNQLMDAFGQALIFNNLIGKVALNGSSCLGPCQAGANVLIYPGAVMYSWVTPEDVPALIKSHVLENTPWPDKLTPAEIW